MTTAAAEDVRVAGAMITCASIVFACALAAVLVPTIRRIGYFPGVDCSDALRAAVSGGL